MVYTLSNFKVTLGPGYCADNFICHPPGAQYQKVAQIDSHVHKNIMKCGVWKFHVDYIEPYEGFTYKNKVLVVLVPGGLCHYCPVITLGGSSFYGAAVDRVQVKLCGRNFRVVLKRRWIGVSLGFSEKYFRKPNLCGCEREKVN